MHSELLMAREQHYEFWEYCQSTSKLQAQVLQNLRVSEAAHREMRGSAGEMLLKLALGWAVPDEA